jgi:hypothetical protein
MDRISRAIDIIDEIEGRGCDPCLAFHFGPDVHVELLDSSAVLSWPAPGSQATRSGASALPRHG